jgi:O-antigen/teichoic acid export membrane protein
MGIQSALGCLALLVTAVIAVATPWICKSPADASLFWKVIIILGINAAMGFPARVYAGVLDATLQFDIQSWLAFLGLALRTGLTVWAIHAGGGLMALAWVMLLASVPTITLQIWNARRVAPWARLKGTPIGEKRTRSFFAYSIYTFITAIADTLRFQVDPLVITSFVGLAAVTHYRVASALMSYYINAVITSTGIVQPILVRSFGAGDRSRMERVFFFATKLSLSISVLIGFLLVFLGKPFILRWMGENYQDAYLPMVVLALAVFLDVGQNPSIGLLYATFNHRFYTYINVAEGIINLILSIALAKPLGILGVALGTLIAAAIVRLAVQPWWVCKAVGLRYCQYVRFVGGTMLRCMLLATVAIGISWWGMKPRYPYLIGATFCATMIYVVGSWMLVFTDEERMQLQTALKSRRPERMESGHNLDSK